MTATVKESKECPAVDKWNCKYCKIVDDCALPNADGMSNNTRKRLEAECAHAEQPAANCIESTPAAEWRLNGEPDPHGSSYDCERAKLCMGKLTDDELANGAYMNYDVRPPIQSIIDGKAFSPIAWMTAVKERIRWLSRRLVEAEEREKKLEVILNDCLKDWSDDAIHEALKLLKEKK
jgi:hypothetical protein